MDSKVLDRLNITFIIGGIICIASSWMSQLDATYVQIDTVPVTIGNITSTLTYDLYHTVIGGYKYPHDDVLLWRAFPITVLVCGVLALFVGLIPKFRNSKKARPIRIAIGAVAVICAILFMILAPGTGMFSGGTYDIVKPLIDSGQMQVKLGAGIFVGLAGSVIMLISGIIMYRKSQ